MKTKKLVKADSVWLDVKLTRNHLRHIRFLARFHLAESENPIAKEKTQKLIWNLDHYPNDPAKEKRE